MKVDKMRELSVEELGRKERELREELFNLRFQNHTGQLENPMKLRLSKRLLARVKTLLREREAAATPGGEGK